MIYKKLISIFCLFNFAAGASAAEQTTPVESLGDVSRIATEMRTRGFDAAGVSLTVGDACSSAMNERYLYANPEDSQKIGFSKDTDSTPLKLAQKAFELFLYQYNFGKDDNVRGNAWQISLQPQELLQQLAVSLNLWIHLGSHNRGFSSIDELKSYLLAGTEDNPSMVGGLDSPSVNDLLKENGNNIAPDYLTQMSDNALAFAACSQGASNVSECVKGLNTLKSKIKHKIVPMAVIFPDILHDVLTNEKYKLGFRNVSLKIINRMEGKMKSTDNIWTDLIGSFREAGLVEPEATEAAWKVMVVAANGSANTKLRLVHFKDLPGWSAPTIIGLTLIGSTLSYLDVLKSKSDLGFYSLPQGIKGQCFSTKWYHFWTYAYMAHILREAGFDEGVSSFAAFIMAKAYQLNRAAQTSVNYGQTKTQIQNKINKQRIIDLPDNHPVNKVMRIDLTLAAAGSIWAATEVGSEGRRQYNIRDGYDLLNKHAAAAASSFSLSNLVDTGTKLQDYYMWDRNFGPNDVYKFFFETQSPR